MNSEAKKKISISIGKTTLRQVEMKLEEGLFRSKSHVIEYAVQKFLANSNDQNEFTNSNTNQTTNENTNENTNQNNNQNTNQNNNIILNTNEVKN